MRAMMAFFLVGLLSTLTVAGLPASAVVRDNPALIRITDFRYDADTRSFAVDESIVRGLATASENADFRIRVSGTIFMADGSVFPVPPKVDPVPSLDLLTKDYASFSVRQFTTPLLTIPDGASNTIMIGEVLGPRGQVLDTTILEKVIIY